MSDLSAPRSVAEAGAKEVRHLPVDPWHALRVHFGMLLGVDDFEVIGAYHRGKAWLHGGWLHGPGVVWGLDVSAQTERGEIRVAPGLALDGLGRELHLDLDHCVNVGRWFAERQTEPGFEMPPLVNGRLTLEAHVTIAFKGCLTRPVPALLEPCDGAGTITAFSRVFETVELHLVRGPAPRPGEGAPPLPYHRLRVLFGLAAPRPDQPDDQAAQDERVRIEGLASAEQPPARLAALRRFGALDVIELGPAVSGEDEQRTLFRFAEPAPLVLAEVLELTLEPVGDGWRMLDATIDPGVRPIHIATSTIQELLCGPACPPATGGDGDGGEDEGHGRVDALIADAGGPRADPASVRMSPRRLRLEVTAELHPASVTPDAFSVTVFDDAGWSVIPIARATAAHGQRVTLELGESLRGRCVRLIARGSGPMPLLGRDLVPLAGAVGGPPGTAHAGHDFVFMQERTEP